MPSEAYVKMIGQINSIGKYQPKSADLIAGEAQQKNNEAYGTMRQGAQNTQNATQDALTAEMNALEQSYQAANTRNNENYEQAFERLGNTRDRQGMGRSNYNNSLHSYMLDKQAELQRKQLEAQEYAQSGITQRQELSANQFADIMAMYDVNQQSDLAALQDVIEAREYDRGVAENDMNIELSKQLYKFVHTEEQQEEEKRQFYAKLAAQKKAAKGGRGRGKSKPKPKPGDKEIEVANGEHLGERVTTTVLQKNIGDHENSAFWQENKDRFHRW